MALQQWALPPLSELLPLDDGELKQILSYTNTLSDSEAAEHLSNLLGDSPQAVQFITAFNEHRKKSGQVTGGEDIQQKTDMSTASDFKQKTDFDTSSNMKSSSGSGHGSLQQSSGSQNDQKQYKPPPGMPPTANHSRRAAEHKHTNIVIDAARVRARDEVRRLPLQDLAQTELIRSQQEMQQMLQNLQFRYGIYNSDIEPEHETDYPCSCAICGYKRAKWRRYGVQEMWSKAVLYPG